DGNGGYTIGTAATIAIFATTSEGNSGNIEIGPGAFLDSLGGYIGIVSLASTSISEGNSGNIQFDAGARLTSLGAGTYTGIGYFGEIVVASVDMASSNGNYHSGNITFLPSTTGVESSVNGNNAPVYIGSVTFNGSSGNIVLGYDVNVIGANTVQIASNAGYGALTTGANSFQVSILNAINNTFGLGLVVPSITNPSGTAGYIKIGAGDHITGGNSSNISTVVIGSYSGLGNSGYVKTFVDSTISASGGYVKIESEALLNDLFAGGTYSAMSSPITIQGGVIAINANVGTPLRIASVGSSILGGIASPLFGDITISSATYTLPPTIPPSVNPTISGAGYLDTSAPTSVAGNVTIAAQLLTIDDEPLTVGGPIPIAINASGAQGGAVNLFGFTGVIIKSGEITTQGGLPPNGGLGVQGSGGAIAISSSGYITIGELNGVGTLVINASSAYNGGGGAVAIFSTAADQTVALYRADIVTSGAGLYDKTDGQSDIGGGGGGAVAIYNASNIIIGNTNITTTGNGSGAIGINSSAGYIAFLGTNVFSSGVVGTPNSSYGGGGGISGSLAGEDLSVGGGGGVKNGFAGGGITNGGYPPTVNTTINAIIVNGFVTLGPMPTGGYGAGITQGGGGYAPNTLPVGGSGMGIGGSYGGSNPGAAGSFTLSAFTQIQFGTPADTSPVSLTTTGSGQYYNGPIVLYAP
ncbi:MAG TPA: hypothetical protein VKJ65_09830, partial [Phycisphaerae bacterium]|nr:hypothetical protein [Phycisphaerae bacterium]